MRKKHIIIRTYIYTTVLIVVYGATRDIHTHLRETGKNRALLNERGFSILDMIFGDATYHRHTLTRYLFRSGDPDVRGFEWTSQKASSPRTHQESISIDEGQPTFCATFSCIRPTPMELHRGSPLGPKKIPAVVLDRVDDVIGTRWRE